MIRRYRKLSSVKFLITFTCLSIICIFQYVNIGYGDYSTQEKISFHKRNLLSYNENSSELANKSKSVKNCMKPDIEQFPKGFSTQKQRIHGLVLLHFLIAFYMFIALSIVCDNYFVPALESICQVFDLKQDVAGATLMAAGSSAPELATSVITLFIAKDVDIGIGTVVGSAVFNIMFVISIVAIFSGGVITLSSYPLIRDSFCYLVSIFAMILCIVDEKVYWYEAFMLLVLYVIYIVLMVFNTKLEACYNHYLKFLKPKNEETENIFDSSNYNTLEDDTDFNEKNEPHNGAYINYNNEGTNDLVEESDVVKTPFEYPREDGIIQKIFFFVCFPLNFIIFYTTPNLKIKFWKKFYPLTFVVSLIWLTLFSYIMVWMITVIGYTFRIPDTIMGLTFIALGASIPDCYSSLIVAKHGHGNMAVSNAIGSNVFDILICLGIPWFICSLSMKKNSNINVKSRGLTYSTLTLFGTVIVLILAIHLNKWKLDKKLGIILMVVYILFVVLASFYELNLLGSNHLPMCLDSLW